MMKKAALIIIVLLLTLAIISACDSQAIDQLRSPQKNESPTTISNMSTWQDVDLIREDYQGSSQNVAVSDNVLTTADHILTMLLFNSSGSDGAQFGVKEFVQVKLNDDWYTVPTNISQREIPLILDPFSPYVDPFSVENCTEYSVDLSVIGTLPPGQYRLVERFFIERLQYEYFALAYFWIIEPGDERPPESESSGPARIEDIALSVVSTAEALRVITDRDEMFDILVANKTGKEYVSTNAVLELWQKGEWVQVSYQHVNLSLVSGWQTTAERLFLGEKLLPGDYRLRLSINVFATTSGIEPDCLFTVVSFDDAPEPEWDISRLSLSELGNSVQNTGVRIIAENTVLNRNNTGINLKIIANNNYNFGEPFSIEVFLDGKWYSVPFANGAFISIGYSTESRTEITHDPVGACGVLPAGQYRIIKAFDLVDQSSPQEVIYLAKEYASAEFTVEETLFWGRQQ